MFDISIIIPAKNEEKRLPEFLNTVITFCRQSTRTYEIIVVDDGSTDDTRKAALAFQKDFPSLGVLSLHVNRGKGHAVKQGFASARGDIVLFLDADGSTGPEEIEKHLPFFNQGYDIVIGSRLLGGVVESKLYRRLMGSFFNAMVHMFLIGGIKDTQCGFKMFRRPVADAVFQPMRLDGFGFDLEILYLAKRKGYRIKEVPVNWRHVDGSKVDLIKDSWRMLQNIFQIRRWHQ
jgi:dolichyl-phosphate beta-glucosyltransferase